VVRLGTWVIVIGVRLELRVRLDVGLG
jgi:hypothetical protein